MKNLNEKILALIGLLKGKKPIVIIITAAIFGLGVLGVKYGYIPEDIINIELIVKQVTGQFGQESTKVVVDSTTVILDTLAK